MKKFISTACAAAIALTTFSFASLQASAAPVVPQMARDQGASDVVQVQHRRWRGGGRHYRGGSRHYRGMRGFYHHGGGAYYNGHRGYRSHRHGYRRYNDWWFPAGAFVAGALIGGALSQPRYYEEPRVIYQPRPVYRRAGGAHVEWCYSRYRSYRAYDNTFQPYHGPRQLCYSPYSY